MPKFLQYISNVLPTTYAAGAMRSIMERGNILQHEKGLNDSDQWMRKSVTMIMIKC